MSTETVPLQEYSSVQSESDYPADAPMLDQSAAAAAPASTADTDYGNMQFNDKFNQHPSSGPYSFSSTRSTSGAVVNSPFQASSASGSVSVPAAAGQQPSVVASSNVTPSSILHYFVLSSGGFQLALIIAFAAFTTYSLNPVDSFVTGGNRTGFRGYEYYKDVMIMMIIGFGFLMSFLRKYGYSAISFTFLITMFTVEWCLLLNGFFANLNSGVWTKIPLNMSALITAMFGSAAVLISFGGLIGKISPSQMLLLGNLELIFYCFNSYICSLNLGVLDMGGSIVIHMFGAYFGLSASRHFSKKLFGPNSFADAHNSYYSDLFSFIGTTFLWIYWPSFNSSMAPESSRLVTTFNTVLALLSSCIAAFYTSKVVREKGKFDVVDIQNATLAGGVSIGATADYLFGGCPIWPMLVGSVAGAISVCGYRYITPRLEERWQIHDTCGIHNLHGMPSVLGAVFSIFASWACLTTSVDPNANPVLPVNPLMKSGQPGIQLAAIIITWISAVVTGDLCARLVLHVLPHETTESAFFTDELWFAVPETVISFTAEDVTDGINTPKVAPQRIAHELERRRTFSQIEPNISSANIPQEFHP